MPNLLPDEPLFTVACSSFNVDSSSILLFHRPKWFKEDIRSLVREPLLPTIIGAPFLLYKDSTKSHMIAAPLLNPEFIASLNTFDASTEYSLYGTREDIVVLRPLDVYNECNSPLKYAIGCDECLLNRDKTNPQCAYVRMCEEKGEPGLSAEETAEKFTSRKSKIGDYTYIGPSLTSSDCIVEALRKVGDHDFIHVNHNTQIRSDAQKERSRHLKFKKEVCPECFVKKSCWAEEYGREGGIRGCEGNYEGTEHQIAQEIIKNVNVPFAHKEILYLLANSGELEKRYNRRKYYTTFRIPWPNHEHRRELEYHLVRVTNPFESQKIRTFEDAKKIIETYSTPRSPHLTTLSTIVKASLIELSCRLDSPTYRNGWRSTSCPTLGITNTSWNGGTLINHYRRNNTEAPWSTSIQNLSDIYANYGCLRFTEKTRSPLGRHSIY